MFRPTTICAQITGHYFWFDVQVVRPAFSGKSDTIGRTVPNSGVKYDRIYTHTSARNWVVVHGFSGQRALHMHLSSLHIIHIGTMCVGWTAWPSYAVCHSSQHSVRTKAYVH